MAAEAAIRREYILDGLCCPMCAEKMQKRIRKLDGVDDASIDFATQKLSLALGDIGKLEGIVAEAGRIARQYEPDIVVAEAAAAAAKPGQKREPARLRDVLGYARLGLGAALLAAGMAAGPEGAPGLLLFFLPAYLLVGADVLWGALRSILKGQVFGEKFLMGIATIGAFAIGEYPEGVAVMLFFQVGEIFERLAVGRSRRSIAALMDIRPDFANIRAGDKLKRVPPDEVAVGEIIVVRPGEKVPLDGIVVEGRSALDTSALTGEPLPRDVAPGSEALSGSVNGSGLLGIRVSKAFGESTVSKILELVQNASGRKSRMESFVTRFAHRYTPAVVLAAALLAVVPPLALPGAAFSEWIPRALVFLVASCPCALVISIPLSFFGGIGCASRNGILVKGGSCLEALDSVDTVVFDKTGTLTKGVFTVASVVPADGFSPGGLLRLAAQAESASTHPIAISIRRARDELAEAGGGAGSESGVEASGNAGVELGDGAEFGDVAGGCMGAGVEAGSGAGVELGDGANDSADGSAGVEAGGAEFEELAGFGVRARIGGRTILAGSAGLLDGIDTPDTGLPDIGLRDADLPDISLRDAGLPNVGLQAAGLPDISLPEAGLPYIGLPGIASPAAEESGTVVHVAADGRYAGRISVADTVKPDSRRAVAALKSLGVKKVAMLTGDSQRAAAGIAAELALDAFCAGLLPGQKVERLEELERLARLEGKGKIAFVGDGINDAPALARADVGCAMGGAGSDAAIEAADVVLMTDEPSKIADAILIARKTKAIVWQNVVFALGVKAAILALGALGLANMWAAVFGDVGVAVIAILNAARAMAIRPGAETPASQPGGTA
ncbi:MAG: heavy metal translocating P-type ATPase [Clostridiales bacterium]|jgi:Cd2+/Zn2+-exporting ATPase|nr:heavy metal translocating P-type ATPase [Clostridiales bacterium]